MTHPSSQPYPTPGPFVWLVLIFVGGTIGYGGWIVKMITTADEPAVVASAQSNKRADVPYRYPAMPPEQPIPATPLRVAPSDDLAELGATPQPSPFYTDPLQPEASPFEPSPDEDLAAVEEGAPIVLRPSRQEPTLAPVPVAVDEPDEDDQPRTRPASQVRTVSIDLADELREAVRSIVGDQPVKITLSDGVCRISGEVSSAADARAIRAVVQRHPAVRVFQDELRVAGAR